MSDIGESGVIDSDEIYLVEMFPLDPTSSPEAETEIYLATRDVYFPPSDPDAPSREYDGRVKQALNYRREIWRDGRIGGGSLPALGAITIAVDDDLVADGDYALWRSYVWDGRRVRVLAGRIGDAYSAYDVLLDGLLSGGNVFGLTEISLGLTDLATRLDRPVHTEKYAGSGGFEGPAELEGADKPWGIGLFQAIDPQPIGTPADLWYDVDPINGLDDAYTPVVDDGGVAYTVTASNPPSSGQVYVDYANGRIRLGTAPTLALRVTAKSLFGASVVGASPAAGAEIAADLAEALLTLNMGLTAGDLDSTSFAALASANTYTLGGWYKTAPTGLEVMDAIMSSVGGYYTTARGGTVTVGIWAAPTATAETDSEIDFVITDQDIAQDTLRCEPVASPPYRIEIGWGRAHAVVGSAEFAGAVTDARRAFLSREYRYAVASNATTEARYLLSEPLKRDTLLQEEADATALAASEAGLYAVARETVRVRLQLRPFSLEPGDQVWIRSDLYAIDAAYRIVGLDDNAEEPFSELLLWR